MNYITVQLFSRCFAQASLVAGLCNTFWLLGLNAVTAQGPGTGLAETVECYPASLPSSRFGSKLNHGSHLSCTNGLYHEAVMWQSIGPGHSGSHLTSTAISYCAGDVSLCRVASMGLTHRVTPAFTMISSAGDVPHAKSSSWNTGAQYTASSAAESTRHWQI